MTNKLEKYIQSYFGLTNIEFDKINLFFKKTEIKKGDYFLKLGK